MTNDGNKRHKINRSFFNTHTTFSMMFVQKCRHISIKKKRFLLYLGFNILQFDTHENIVPFHTHKTFFIQPIFISKHIRNGYMIVLNPKKLFNHKKRVSSNPFSQFYMLRLFSKIARLITLICGQYLHVLVLPFLYHSNLLYHFIISFHQIPPLLL